MPKRDLTIDTADGRAPAALFTPDAGPTPTAGVLFLMDAFGPRPALDAMAARLAGEGYAVLLPDLLYRALPYGPFEAKTAFAVPETREALTAAMATTPPALTERDTAAFLGAFDAAGVTGPIAAVGYCMGGSRALLAAAAHPGRVVAAASFHGGNLAADTPDSPHTRAGAIRARVYVGCAGVDRSFPPEQSTRFAAAFREAGVDFVLENYAGLEHGWAVPDHRAYDAAGAERHHRRLVAFLAETLAAAGER